jgi:hypothetical protein
MTMRRLRRKVSSNGTIDAGKGPGYRYPEPESDDTEFRLQIPANPNLLPPGHYQLFIVSRLGDPGYNFTGAPSLGHIIRVG